MTVEFSTELPFRISLERLCFVQVAIIFVFPDLVFSHIL